MKKYSIYIIIFIIVVILIFCLTNSKKTTTEVLNVLNWSSYIPQSVINDFESETGIKVNYSTYSSNEELLAKVSNVKEGTYDLVFPSDYMVEVLKNKDLLEKIDKSKISNIDNLNSSFLNQYFDPDNEYSIPFIAATTVISVNTKCDLDPIESYNDLLNEKYKNNIVLIDDERIIIGMALLATGHDMNSTNVYDLDEAYQWLLKLKPNIKAYDSDSPKNFMITNETCVGVIWNAEGALASMNNSSIESIFPIEGSALSIDNFTILKGAKNEDNAYKFIEYILRPEVMEKIIESYPYINVNTKTNDYLDDEYINNKAINVSEEDLNNSHFVKNIGTYISYFDDVWMKIK